MPRWEGKVISACLPFWDACSTLFSEFCLGFFSWVWYTASGTRSTVAGLQEERTGIETSARGES
jgi:hypothetical protein